MGPGDPYGAASESAFEAAGPDDETTTLSEGTTEGGEAMGSENLAALVVLVGLFLGVVVGAFAVYFGPFGALTVLGAGAVGVGLVWVVFSVATGRIDLGAAWRALLWR